MTRFGKLVNSLAHRKHAPRNPKAVAAFIGRKKYGPKKFAKMSAAGRRKHRRK